MIQGNDFKLVVPTERKGESRVMLLDAYLKGITGEKYHLEAVVKDDTIEADVDGDLLPCGKYGLLLSGTRNGNKFRRYIEEALTITMNGEDSEDIYKTKVVTI